VFSKKFNLDEKLASCYFRVFQQYQPKPEYWSLKAIILKCSKGEVQILSGYIAILECAVELSYSSKINQ